MIYLVLHYQSLIIVVLCVSTICINVMHLWINIMIIINTKLVLLGTFVHCGRIQEN